MGEREPSSRIGHSADTSEPDWELEEDAKAVVDDEGAKEEP